MKKELPEYVKFIWEENELQDIRKVEKWVYQDFENAPNTLYGFEYDMHKGRFLTRMSLNGWTPSTKNEYNDFISKLSD